jgi:hypothetical protein
MTTGEMHVEDGVLVRLIDEEAEAGERIAAEAHLLGCADCDARLRRLRRRGQRLTLTLGRVDVRAPESLRPPVQPSRPSQRHWLRMAAGIALLVGLAAIGTPARAWIAALVNRLSSGVEAPRARPPVAAPPVVEAPAPVEPASRVGFVVSGSELTIELANRQRGGAIHLSPVQGSRASVEVVAGTGGAELLVLPSSLRIANRPGARTEYRLGVPAAITRVRIRVTGESLRIVNAAEIGSGLRVQLD